MRASTLLPNSLPLLSKQMTRKSGSRSCSAIATRSSTASLTTKRSRSSTFATHLGALGNRNSLRLDARGLDDRPPLLDLGPVVGSKSLGGLHVPRGNLLADVDEPLLHRRIAHRLD